MPASTKLLTALLGVLLLQPAVSSEITAVTVREPWFRYILPQIPAGGYMMLQNSSSRVAVLTGATSHACGMLMMHQSKAGMMAVVRTVSVPPHGTFLFSPGGYHLMCMRPRMKPGEPVPVTLTFQDGREVSAMFPVFGANAEPSVEGRDQSSGNPGPSR